MMNAPCRKQSLSHRLRNNSWKGTMALRCPPKKSDATFLEQMGVPTSSAKEPFHNS